MKELAIGEELRIRCVEDTNVEDTNDTITACSDCIFVKMDCATLLGDCIPCDKSARKDGKNVHFEIVEE